MIIQTYDEGRRLMVQFECRRCGCAEVRPYSEVMTGEHYGYLRNSELPKGWQKVDYCTLLCPKCYDEYAEFMNIKKQVVLVKGG